jgi:hypothetical protein
VTGEGAVDASTIKKQYVNFLILFIFNPMVEVPLDGKFTGDNPFSYNPSYAQLTRLLSCCFSNPNFHDPRLI